MTREEWQRIKRIAGDARELPADRQAAFVAAECAGDEVLRHQVRALVTSTAAAESLYELPAVTIDGAPAIYGDALRHAAVTTGTHIGPYRVVREIGRGGMGSVYLGVRVDGAFEQQVAIKVVSGVASDDLLRRFENERRILATLEHANIARLLDGGSTPEGVPYLSMEYVDGLPIDEYCEAKALDLVARLQLFRRVCATVHYAHQRLVIHRDIKAGNILVTVDGTPKLLDFGIAKVLTPGDADMKTVLRAMTPESASPEQVRGEPITIAADVYALGVLLYRLLSGHSPYGSLHRTEADLLREICDETPVPPLVARARSGAPPWSKGRFAKDLDMIVLMALRKEPERRYGSAAQFADDIERFLRQLPVRAAPDSRTYGARKFLARHRKSVAVAATALVAVLGGAFIAAHQSSVALRERNRAERRFSDVRRMANVLVFEFHDAIAELPGSLAARQLVVTRAAGYLDQLASEAQDDVTLQRELATANVRLADIMGGGGASNLGDIPGAESRYLAALSLFRRLTERPQPDPADIEGLAQVDVQMSRLLVLKGDLPAAERSAHDAVALLMTNGRDGTAKAAMAYHQLGFVQGRRGHVGVALESLNSATVSARRQLADDQGNEGIIARFARIATDYGDQLAKNGRYAEALSLFGEARVQIDRLLQRDPLNTRYRMNSVYLLNLHGQALQAQRRDREALASFSEATATAESLHQSAPDDSEIRLTLMISRHWYGTAMLHAGDTASGVQALRRAVHDGETLVEQAPGNAYAATQLAAARVELGEALLGADSRSREGCSALRSGLQSWQALDARGQRLDDPEARRRSLERLAMDCVKRQ